MTTHYIQEEWLFKSISVSYTHLDVYKRQVLNVSEVGSKLRHCSERIERIFLILKFTIIAFYLFRNANIQQKIKIPNLYFLFS